MRVDWAIGSGSHASLYICSLRLPTVGLMSDLVSTCRISYSTETASGQIHVCSVRTKVAASQIRGNIIRDGRGDPQLALHGYIRQCAYRATSVAL